MIKYGIKIKSFDAALIYKCNIGRLERFSYSAGEALFANSLFCDFIYDDLKISNGWTKDLISIKFSSGIKNYKDELKSYDEKIKKLEKKRSETQGEKGEKALGRINKVISNFEEQKKTLESKINEKESFLVLTRKELREKFYREGIDIEYPEYTKKKELKKVSKIHYKMLYRSTGKAKEGSCIFINEKLYEKAISFLRMGMKLPKKNAPIVEIGAYSSLVASTIVGRVKIDPKNILVIKDVDVPFSTKAIRVFVENGRCKAEREECFELKNTLFDGQALIESSVFDKAEFISEEEKGNGFILLRHHFCKTAAFCANIQLFYRDYCETHNLDYDSLKVTDMFGNEHFAKDIELITTEKSMKWDKFNVKYSDWCSKVSENGNCFGIVKTAHPSKFGEYQRMSYQMVNALEIDVMPEVLLESKNYIEELKNNDEAFLDFLKASKTYTTDFDVLVVLCEQDPDFLRSEYFKKRRSDIIYELKNKFEQGKIFQNAENLVIVGSPYAMLLESLRSAGESYENDNTFYPETDSIQCFSKRFENNEYLAEFRSPFNSKNNMGYLHNHYDERLEKYFNFGNQIIAVNLIGTDFQHRNNGADQDSDFIYTTNQKEIVACAKKNYQCYPTIVNDIKESSKLYENTPEAFAEVDDLIAKAKDAIGRASNLAQLCLSYSYNFEGEEKEEFEKKACILSVLAQVAIDNAKRSFDVNLVRMKDENGELKEGEIDQIGNEMNISKNGIPEFWGKVHKNNKKDDSDDKKENEKSNEQVSSNDENDNEASSEQDVDESLNKQASLNEKDKKKKIDCPMNHTAGIEVGEMISSETIPMKEFFINFSLETKSRRERDDIENYISEYSKDYFRQNMAYQRDEENDDSYLLTCLHFQDLLDTLQERMKKNKGMSIGTTASLIDRAFRISKKRKSQKLQCNTNKNKSLLLKILYLLNDENVKRCFSKNITK